MLIILLFISAFLYVLGKAFKSEIMEVIGAALGIGVVIAIILGSAFIVSVGDTSIEQLQEYQKVIRELETLKESTITNYTQNIPEKESTDQEQEAWIQKLYSDIAIIESQISEMVDKAKNLEQAIAVRENIKYIVYFGGKQ